MKIQLFSFALVSPVLAQSPDWENPAIFRINKEAPRATSVPFPERKFHTLNLDHRHSGLGGTDSWGAIALPQYLIQPDKTYQWSFLLSLPETPAMQSLRPAVLPRQLPIPQLAPAK